MRARKQTLRARAEIAMIKMCTRSVTAARCEDQHVNLCQDVKPLTSMWDALAGVPPSWACAALCPSQVA